MSSGCGRKGRKNVSHRFQSRPHSRVQVKTWDGNREVGEETYHAKFVKHRRVKSVLDIINTLRDQAQSQLSVHEQVVQQTVGSVVAVA